MSGLRFRSFSYSIDYDKEIAADEAEIATLTSEACIRVATELVPAAEARWPGKQAPSWLLYHLVLNGDIATIHKQGEMFGLTPDDLRAWAYFCNEDRDDIVDDLGPVQPGDYRRGAAVDTRMERIPVYSEASRKRALSKARASLARHKRNKAKFGG